MEKHQVVMVRGLCKAYRRRRVVDRLDLDVYAGEIVGLIGANGAGKTTTVECVQGLRRACSGTLRVLGLDPAKDRDRLRTVVGSQLQSSALPDRLRVDEAVQLFCGRRRDDLLDRFGLVPRRRSPFASLSGGERQRLFLVLALANRPRLVILDELTQALDPAARRSVWQAVDELRSDGTAVLLVTHELDEAEHLCDRVTAMQAGRTLASGTPADLVDRYGRSATVRFSVPAALDIGPLLEKLSRLPGVSAVEHGAGKVAVAGDRTAVARVGAVLVQVGWIPPDLSVKIPSLEDALVGLLGNGRPGPVPALDLARPQTDDDPQPIGAVR